MSTAMRLRRGFALGAAFLFGSLSLATPARGQLSLVSSTPADGDTEVDTMLTLILEFSAPLDTTVRFEDPGEYYLGLQVFPADSVGDPEGDITLSADSTSVTIADIPLTPDTKFVLVLTGARSAAGDPLDRPYGITFTTGNTLPQGSVSGTVSYPGGDPGGTAVGLFLEPPFSDDDDEEDGGPDLEAGAVVPLSADTYIANFVPAGSYYVLGLKDVNRDGEFEFPGDAFGGYDADGDSLADRITVGEGQDLSGIDFTIGLSPEVTARETYPGAQNAAQAFFPDAQLSVLAANSISPEGTSENWLYGFYSTVDDSVFGVSRVGGTYFPFSFPLGGGDDGPTILPDTPLPENWIDSDMAADTAEAYVGGEFRAQYPDVVSTSFAATFFFDAHKDLYMTGRGSAGWPAMASSIDEANRHIRPAAASVDTFSAWVFSYFSEQAGEDRHILLDVETGSPIGFPGPGEPSAARDNLGTADAAAALWAVDAALVTVGNADQLSPEGSAYAWGYAYYSAAKDSVLVLFIISDIITGQETESTDAVASLTPLPPGWLDSPQVTSIAEAASGDFRNQHLDAWVSAQLSYGLRPGQPSLAVWRFMYQSSFDQIWLFIYVDALTGEIVTDVQEPEELVNIPGGFALQQNYPNPFNPGTTIDYALPREDRVEVAIFNLLGQRVRVLVDEVKPAGRHAVRWDGADEAGRQLSSGVYFCRMRVGEFRQVMKMILIR